MPCYSAWISDEWEPEVKKQHEANTAIVRNSVLAEYGPADEERKRRDLIDLGSLPLSVLAFHNKFQARTAFVAGGYFPALTGICALGERVLNHLLLGLREAYRSTSQYKKVYGKDSFDNWDMAIETLEAWDVLLPRAAEAFRELKTLRHRAIHFRPETDTNDRALALCAIQQFSILAAEQFGAFGGQPWFIREIEGAGFLKKDWESRPFIRAGAADGAAPHAGHWRRLSEVMVMAESGYFFIGDLLGFSRIIANLTPESAEERVQAWVSLVEEAARAAGVDRIQLISDTVFAATDGTEAGLAALIQFSKALLDSGVARSLPVRGAISFGPFSWGRLTHGKAVVECHDLEQRQQWIGVACSSGLPHVTSQWSISKLVCYPPPLASGVVRLQPVIAWAVPAFGVLTKALTGNGLTRDGDQMPWEFAHKVGNTIQLRLYLRFLEQTGGAPSVFHGLHPLHVIDEHFARARTVVSRD